MGKTLKCFSFHFCSLSSKGFIINFRIIHYFFRIINLFFPHFFPENFCTFFFFILSGTLLKQLHIRLQNNVNYLGSKFLSTRYSNFWWFLSQSFILRCLQVTYDIHLPLLLFSLVIEKHVLRTFALIVSAHPYCAREFTCHVIHERAR